MPRKHDIRLIAHLRNNARKRVTSIAREESTPATTMYDRLKANEKSIIKKYTALLDFQKLGFNAKTHIAIKAEKDSREKLEEFLASHPNVNSLYRINSGHDFLAECVFRNIASQKEFIEELQSRNAELAVYDEVEELKKEEFLSMDTHLGV